jgi:ferredoxin
MAATKEVVKQINVNRKKKPKALAVINEGCTGCAGSPMCQELCPVADCMILVRDDISPVFGRIIVDPLKCIGCQKCISYGPEGTYLEGCPWDAIDMVPTEEFEAEHGELAY